MEENIMDYIQEKITKEQLSGVILQVNQQGETVIQKAFGKHLDLDSPIHAGKLVEVVAILPLILKLVERRRSKLALNHKVSQYLPEFQTEKKENIQIMNLLTHTSGLSDTEPTEVLSFQPGSKIIYNPYNFSFLPDIFEQVSDQSFHGFYENFILDPMLMEQTKLTDDYELYTTVPDLSRYATMIEQDGTYDYLKIINKKTVQLSKQNFTSFLNENRGLGWELSENGYGFLVDEQTSLWFEPKNKQHIVLHLVPFFEGETADLEEIRRNIFARLNVKF